MAEIETKIIYHYTSRKGLRGILETKTLWATDVSHLKDHIEFKHALTIAKSKLEELAKKLQGKDLRFIEHAYHLLEVPHGHRVFTVSFSTERNSPRMWKDYASDSHGFCIGFSLDTLKAWGEGPGKYYMVECVYDQSQQSETIQKTLEQSLFAFRERVGNLDETSPSLEIIAADCAGLFYAILLQYAPYMKDPNLADEKEWRIMCHYSQDYPRLNPDKPEYRNAGSSLVPYELVCLPLNFWAKFAHSQI